MSETIQLQQILSWRILRLVLCMGMLVATATLFLPMFGFSFSQGMNEYAKTFAGKHMIEGGSLTTLSIAGILCLSTLQARVGYVGAICIFIYMLIGGLIEFLIGICH